MFKTKFSILVLFLAIAFSSCKQKSIDEIIQNIEIKVDASKKISLGSLTIYPIINLSKTNQSRLPLKALSKVEGVLVKDEIENIRAYTDYILFNVANKSTETGLIPFGQILKNNAGSYLLANHTELLRAKHISEIKCLELSIDNLKNSNKKNYPILACPPIPLKNILLGKKRYAITWLREALNSINYSLTEDPYSGYSNNEDEELYPARTSMQNLPSEEDFQAHFSTLAQNINTTGFLAVYQNKIIISQLFDDAHFFKEEWPSFSRSIYVNQMMGYSASEFNALRKFDGVKESERRIKKLWTQTRVMAKDHAYRKEVDREPIHLVWF